MNDKNLPDEFWTDADVVYPSDVNTFTVKMNAKQLRMYVAAPELLDALERIEKYVYKGMLDRSGPVLRQARAAIAKAKGEPK